MKLILMLLCASLSVVSSSFIQHDREYEISSPKRILIRSSENNSEAILTSIRDAVVSQDGCVYLIDANRVLVYSPEGKYIRQIGKSGQGPGEYCYPKKLRIDSTNRLWINDQGRSMILYDSEGKFQRQFSFESEGFLEEFEILSNGSILGVWDVWNENGQKKIIGIIGENGRSTKTIKEYDVLKEKVGNVVGGISHSYLPDASIALLDGGLFCFGYNMIYRIYILDQEFGERANFGREEKPESTNREKREIGKKYGRDMLKNYHLPEWKPFFEDILVDETQRIFVVRTRPMIRPQKPEPTRIDVFTNEGCYLGLLKCSGIPKSVRNGRLYSIDQDEEESPIIAVYRLPETFSPQPVTYPRSLDKTGAG